MATYLIKTRDSILHMLSASENKGSYDFSLYIENIVQIVFPPQPITEFPTYI